MNDVTKIDEGSYYFLWHLQQIGVIKTSQPSGSKKENIVPHIEDTLWDKIESHDGYGSLGETSKIALIDVGVSKSHPNLDGQVDKDDSIDFASNRFGVKYKSLSEDEKPPMDERFFVALDKRKVEANKLLDDLKGQIVLEDGDTELLGAIVSKLAKSEGVVLNDFDDPDENFGGRR